MGSSKEPPIHHFVEDAYADLRHLAHQAFRQQRPGETLQPTALVHEAFLKMSRSGVDQFQDRIHFLALASKVMRQIMVDHVRGKLTQKRAGHLIKVSLEDVQIPNKDGLVDLLELNEALERLEQSKPRLAKIVELKFFGGLKNADIAKVLDFSVPTIEREWRLAKTLLFRALTSSDKEERQTQ